MRLSEEIVALLKLIESHSDLAGISTDTIEDAAHEGLILQKDSKDPIDSTNFIDLTPSGKQTLASIQNSLLTADQLSINENAKIAYLSQNNYPRFQKLSSFGLFPGIPISLKQRYPSFVIQCEETQIALEEEILKDIFVWRSSVNDSLSDEETASQIKDALRGRIFSDSAALLREDRDHP